jgi:hypothetical protein
MIHRCFRLLFPPLFLLYFDRHLSKSFWHSRICHLIDLGAVLPMKITKAAILWKFSSLRRGLVGSWATCFHSVSLLIIAVVAGTVTSVILYKCQQLYITSGYNIRQKFWAIDTWLHMYLIWYLKMTLKIDLLYIGLYWLLQWILLYRSCKVAHQLFLFLWSAVLVTIYPFISYTYIPVIIFSIFSPGIYIQFISNSGNGSARELIC